jgi:hypothetical protein
MKLNPLRIAEFANPGGSICYRVDGVTKTANEFVNPPL